MPPADPVRVVIVGGGFGGLYAATYLARSELAEQRAVDVTLVDQRNYFTFTPLLAEVASGTLGREHVTYSFRVLAYRYGFRFVHARADEVDVTKRCVRTSRAELPYDYLVLAVGAEPGYFGNTELQEHALPMTSVADALRVRARVVGALNEASVTRGEDRRRRLLTFVVAGAGPAGVETASEIHGLANRVLRPYFPGLPPARVILADGGPRILGAFDETLARQGEAVLRRRGLDVRLVTRIAGAQPGRVRLLDDDGEHTVEAETLVWTAGTTPRRWLDGLNLPLAKGAVKVDHYLRVPGQQDVFAVGDATMLMDPRTERPYPRVAPIAISQGIRAAANIENLAFGRPLEPYEAHHAGKIVSLGDGVALIELLGFRVTGPLAWWLYRAAYLLKLVGTKNKVRVAVTLLLNRIFEPDVTYEEAAR